MDFAPVPATAAWRHRDARAGFEVVYFHPFGEGSRAEGWTTAIEDGSTWAVEYVIDLDVTGATRSARVRGRSAAGYSLTLLEADGAGRWLVDGVPAPCLDGCLDVDLESSAMTNALPVRRMGLAPWRPCRCSRRLRPGHRPCRGTAGADLPARPGRGRTPALRLRRPNPRLHLPPYL
jgi:hypothetical protein